MTEFSVNAVEGTKRASPSDICSKLQSMRITFSLGTSDSRTETVSENKVFPAKSS